MPASYQLLLLMEFGSVSTNIYIFYFIYLYLLFLDSYYDFPFLIDFDETRILHYNNLYVYNICTNSVYMYLNCTLLSSCAKSITLYICTLNPVHG